MTDDKREQILRGTQDLSAHTDEICSRVNDFVFDGVDLDENVLIALLADVTSDIVRIIRATCDDPSEDVLE